MLGKKFIISGISIEIVSDAGKKWQVRNITTKEMVFISKAVLKNAIKLGKAEEILLLIFSGLCFKFKVVH